MGKRLFAVLVLVFLWAAVGHASTSSMRSLLIHTSPKVSGLGDACSAVPDAICAEVNPAAVAFAEGTLIGFAHGSWFEGIDLGAFDLYASSKKHGFGVSLVALGSGNLEKYSSEDKYEGTFSVYDFLVNALYSYRVGPTTSLAVTGRVVYEKIDWDAATGFAVDLGALHLLRRPFIGGRWGFGLAVRNLGPSISFTDGSNSLPLTVQGGISYSPEFLPEQVSAAIAVDYRKTRYEDGSPLAGIEVGISKFLWLRAGGRFNHDHGDLTFGAGVKIKNVMVDYAYVDYSERLGDTHRIALAFNTSLIFPAPEESR